MNYCGDNGTSVDAALSVPHRGVKGQHRGVKGQLYEGGMMVPRLMEWPARIPIPRTTMVQASTSDLLPTQCALIDEPLPDRLRDGIDLRAAIGRQISDRPGSLGFWEFDTKRLAASDASILAATPRPVTPVFVVVRG